MIHNVLLSFCFNIYFKSFFDRKVNHNSILNFYLLAVYQENLLKKNKK